MIYILLSNYEFAWINQLKIEDGNYNLESSSLLSVEEAINILVVNLQQVAVQSIRGITIFNVKTKAIDFKVKFIEDCMIDLSTGFGMIAVPRRKNGILLDFGVFD